MEKLQWANYGPNLSITQASRTSNILKSLARPKGFASDPQIRSLVLYPAELRAHPRCERAEAPSDTDAGAAKPLSLVVHAMKRKAPRSGSRAWQIG